MQGVHIGDIVDVHVPDRKCEELHVTVHASQGNKSFVFLNVFAGQNEHVRSAVAEHVVCGSLPMGHTEHSEHTRFEVDVGATDSYVTPVEHVRRFVQTLGVACRRNIDVSISFKITIR